MGESVVEENLNHGRVFQGLAKEVWRPDATDGVVVHWRVGEKSEHFGRDSHSASEARLHSLDSRSGNFSWSSVQNAQATIPSVIWRTNVITPTDTDVAFDHSDYVYEWRLHWSPFDAGTVHDPGEGLVRAFYVILPYFGSAVPLTLLSAFLLLAKPRSSNQKKILEPIPVERT